VGKSVCCIIVCQQNLAFSNISSENYVSSKRSHTSLGGILENISEITVTVFKATIGVALKTMRLEI